MTVAIIGGGAAGLLCACLSARGGADVTLFEKNASGKLLSSEAFFDNAYLGKKLLITGKGRCNLTNNCDKETFFSSVVTGAKFLYAAYDRFPPQRTMAFFEEAGLALKTERGNRVFPVSDKVLDVLRTLKTVLRKENVAVKRLAVTSVQKDAETFVLTDENGIEHRFDAVVVATGGLSYPVTGSTGDGYRFAEAFGHTVTPRIPSLVPFEVEEQPLCSSLAGLAPKNVTLTVTDREKKKPVFSELGEMLFTHTGVSGPLVLSASAHTRPMEPGRYTLHIDWKPALSPDTVDKKLVALFAERANTDLANVLCAVLPKSMAAPMARFAHLDPAVKPHDLKKEDRRRLAASLKDFTLTVAGFRPIDEAVVTSGGVKTSEIVPSTMESKRVPGLYFIGEVLDLDAYTGGFNLQIAFMTAACAAASLTE